MVDRPRPRVCDDDVSTNYGSVAVVAVPGVRLTRLDVGIQCESYKLLCVRVTSASFCVAVVVYRTGPVTPAYFTELSDVLDRVSTFNDPILVVGDVNIRLDRPDDLVSRQFTDTLAAHGLACRVTHYQGGLLDVVTTRDDLPLPPVKVVDVVLVYRTTGCCGGLCRLPCRLQSTRRGQVDRGIILTLSSFTLHWCRPAVSS